MDGFPSGIQIQDHLITIGNVMQVAAGANAGGSPPGPVKGTLSNDTRFSLTFGSGTGPAAGAVAKVTFNLAYADTTYVVHVTPTNKVTSELGVPYITEKAVGTFVINFPIAMAASQANTVYAVDVLIVG